MFWREVWYVPSRAESFPSRMEFRTCCSTKTKCKAMLGDHALSIFCCIILSLSIRKVIKAMFCNCLALLLYFKQVAKWYQIVKRCTAQHCRQYLLSNLENSITILSVSAKLYIHSARYPSHVHSFHLTVEGNPCACSHPLLQHASCFPLSHFTFSAKRQWMASWTCPSWCCPSWPAG